MTLIDLGLLCFVPVLVLLYGMVYRKPWKELSEDDLKELFPGAFVVDCDFNKRILFADVKKVSDKLKEKNT